VFVETAGALRVFVLVDAFMGTPT